MSLTHVCVWEAKNGYRRISIEEACKMYPHGVSANSGIFACELCAKAVLLTAPGSNTRHFRHTSKDETKACEDRAQAYNQIIIKSNHPQMPIKIELTQNSYILKLGFLHMPSFDRTKPVCRKVVILGDQQQFTYSAERIFSEGVTYLNIGNIPSSIYRFRYEGVSSTVGWYYPSSTEGVNPEGSFFDCASGKMFLRGSKIYSHRSYYLLQKGTLGYIPDGINCHKIMECKTDMFTTWRLYQVQVLEFSKEVARFFLARSVFLTENPVEFYPIWPCYTKDQYFIYHTEPTVYFYMQGDEAELHAYPSFLAVTKSEKLTSGKIYRISATSKEQLVSFGQSGVLGFSYLMKKTPNICSALPDVQIKDIDGRALDQQVYNILPKGKQIILQAPYSGKVVILRKDSIQEIRAIPDEEEITVDKLTIGCEVQIFQGCDLVRTIRFESQRKLKNNNFDRQIVAKLNLCKDNKIPVSHGIGVIAVRLKDYPLTQTWIYHVIRQGWISRSAYYLLCNLVKQNEGMK